MVNTLVSPGEIYDSNSKAIGDNALESKVLSEVTKATDLKITVDIDL